MNTLDSINNNYESYQQLITFYHDNKKTLFNDIHLKLTGFFAANMTAALGAILDKFVEEGTNTICFHELDAFVKNILQKNDFLSYYGAQKKDDTYQTTIKYQKLKPTDGKYFKNYVINPLIGRLELPNMTSGLRNKIVEAIYEIFVNAQTHSQSSHIYTCGQFFPNKAKIEFTVVDIGIGFKEKVNQRFTSNLSAEKAIQWAVRDMKTTKEGIPGGIGLALLQEFVEMNKGKVQIVSDAGYYEYNGKNSVAKLFHNRFPGTVVNLQFRTDDTANY